MKTKDLLLATLAGTVVYFLLGWLIYGLLFMKFFEANAGSASGVNKEPMLWWAMILGSIAFAFLLALIFNRWAGISTFMGGLKAGAIITLLMGLTFNFMQYSMSNLMNFNGTIVDIIIYAIIGGITGGVIGWVLGMGKKE
ncbi:MAG: DUF1761 domain-containing protein [Bacteroidetes bacterium]|nr:DUF1761 domain-containing protein [Bacteroidota bacterium]